MAVVNPITYTSFVDENWEFEQLMKHFIDEMNKGTLIIGATGMEGEWNVIFSNKVSEGKSFREFNKTIEVTDGELIFTNFEDLTMAAQFNDEKLPSKHYANLLVSLDNGIYDVTVRQMFDPNDYNHDTGGKINFEVVIQPSANMLNPKIENVFWRQ